MRHYTGPAKVTETCSRCQTIHDVRVQVDEQGPYVEIETEPCNDDDCEVRLCSGCSIERCEVCALNFCPSHVREVDGEKMCRSCESKMIKEGQVSA